MTHQTYILIPLTETYCMIDTCPPQIATWSSDGLTFLVKNTHLFETTIIPQYFKHSKFSSFVRQLNFYGFRKIRLDNSLKIDLEKEREQRNFWRFRHENFRRGRKDLLREIKRSASSSSTAVSPNAVMSTNSISSSVMANSPSQSNTVATTPAAVAAVNTSPLEVTRLNTEVTVLKEQMQSMATKMEDLTDLVKTMKVSPHPYHHQQQQQVEEASSCGNKRKKTDVTMMLPPESVPSMMTTMMMMTMGDDDKMEEVDVDVILPSFPNDNAMMSLEDAATTLLPDLALSSSSNPSSVGPSSLLPTPVLSRCSSLGVVPPTTTTTAAAGSSGAGGEEDFVDELFHAFATDEDTPLLSSPPPPQQHHQQVVVEENPNKPDPQLMKRIEDSLSTIPKTMHEMVANRLIDAIAEGNASIEGSGGATIVRSPSSSSSSSSSTMSSPDKENALNRSSSIIPESGSTTTTTSTAEAEKTSIPLPLAIATLKTILADYGLKVECGSSSEDAMVHRRLSNKSLPLVPMHA